MTIDSVLHPFDRACNMTTATKSWPQLNYFVIALIKLNVKIISYIYDEENKSFTIRFSATQQFAKRMMIASEKCNPGYAIIVGIRQNDLVMHYPYYSRAVDVSTLGKLSDRQKTLKRHCNRTNESILEDLRAFATEWELEFGKVFNGR